MDLESAKGNALSPEAATAADKLASDERKRLKVQEQNQIQQIEDEGERAPESSVPASFCKTSSRFRTPGWSFQKQLEAGQNVEFQLRKAIESRLALQEQEIALQAELLKKQTEDPAGIAQIEQQAQLQIANARRSAREEVEKTTAAIKKQAEESRKATSLDLGGNAYGIDKFFADNQGFFDITKSSKKKAPGGFTPASWTRNPSKRHSHAPRSRVVAQLVLPLARPRASRKLRLP